MGGCRKCDYDECEACALKSRSVPASPKASPLRASPRGSPRPSSPQPASPSPAGAQSASASPPIRRQVSSARKEKHATRKVRAQPRRESPAAAGSDDDDDDDEEEETPEEVRPKGKQSRRRK